MNLREHARSPVRQARRRTARVRCSTPENLESLGRSFERRQECHSEPETRNLGPGAVDHGRYRNCQPLWISENRSRTGVPKGRPFGGGLGGGTRGTPEKHCWGGSVRKEPGPSSSGASVATGIEDYEPHSTLKRWADGSTFSGGATPGPTPSAASRWPRCRDGRFREKPLSGDRGR